MMHEEELLEENTVPAQKAPRDQEQNADGVPGADAAPFVSVNGAHYDLGHREPARCQHAQCADS